MPENADVEFHDTSMKSTRIPCIYKYEVYLYSGGSRMSEKGVPKLSLKISLRWKSDRPKKKNKKQQQQLNKRMRGSLNLSWILISK